MNLRRPEERMLSHATHITDFDDLAQVFTHWEGRFEQMSRGRFTASLCIAHGEILRAHLGSANQSLLVTGRDQRGGCDFSLILPESARCLWQGRILNAGNVVIRSADIAVNHQTSKVTTNLSFTISEAALRGASRAIMRTEPKQIGWHVVTPHPAAFFTLNENLRRWLRDSQIPRFLGSQESRQIEQDCVDVIVNAMTPTNDNRRPDLLFAGRARLVREAEDFMRSRLSIPTGTLDLCEELGVSGRTLRLAFNELRGLGPLEYFQTLRLNAARTALKSSAPDTNPVAEVARMFGFTHLGKFASYYRRLFAELPSQTVKEAHR